MKIFKHRNLMGCIYALLMAVPLFSILGRTCYSIFNKNAHESYSGNITENVYQDLDSSLPIYDVYFSFNRPMETSDFASNRPRFNITNIEVIDSNLTSTYLTSLGNTNTFKIWYDNGTTYINWTDLGTNLSNTTYWFTIKCDLVSISEYNFSSYSTQMNNLFYQVHDLNGLDNAFDYSLSKFVNDNDFGRLNFFQWFWDIFLTNTQQNNLYIHFVNWYMNYALCVSSAYILFLVLMWFINYSRRILERGMNYDW